MLTKILLVGEMPRAMTSSDVERAVKEIVKEAVWMELSEGEVSGYFVHLTLDILCRIAATGLPLRILPAPNTSYKLRMMIGKEEA